MKGMKNIRDYHFKENQYVFNVIAPDRGRESEGLKPDCFNPKVYHPYLTNSRDNISNDQRLLIHCGKKAVDIFIGCKDDITIGSIGMRLHMNHVSRRDEA